MTEKIRSAARTWVLPALLLAVLGVGLLISDKAEALADPLGGAAAYQISCGTTALKLHPASGDNKAYSSFRVFNNSATPVYIGGSNVNTSTLGYPICTDTATCESKGISIDGLSTAFWCKAGSSVTVTLIAGRK